ncbi:uncharacterized protein MONBRDRAFT_31472 [Monosiga brevicollis MX1]|uniref:Nuclear condensin complex subunit 3 C-terminal domain-containing protein n=1 Tax=Monosiga brevicollis TaxID=81824 RepID=A9UTE1_MONBE|nr:uncharacterized protein MONBRDRAFT_31472 [Monosiga brevicollis MX1]EDQ91232.1 predicted protein [Monosiga brevicollis MX1]|eukprot:XP_001743654.1 hypothetical protein [Monosiga brevicollis MX1]
MSVAQLFANAQRSKTRQEACADGLLRLMLEQPADEFAAAFRSCFERCLLIFKREPAVERIIEMVPEGASMVDMVLTRMTAVAAAQDKSVRFRACQVISRVLNRLSDGTDLSEELYDALETVVLDRMHDKIPAVRVQAVKAAGRLQAVDDADCPIVQRYLALLSKDSSADVRCAVLQQLIFTKNTKTAILARSRDIKTPVRVAFFKAMLDQAVHYKAISVAQRVALLRDGLLEREDAVRKQATKLALSWFRLAGGLDALLDAIDVELNVEVAEALCQAILNSEDVTMEALNLSALSPSRTFFWVQACKFLQQQKRQEDLEAIMPSASALGDRVVALIDSHAVAQEIKNEPSDDEEEVINNAFVVQQLLLGAELFDADNEFARRELSAKLRPLVIKHFRVSEVIAPCMKLLAHLHPHATEFTTVVVELLRDILEPVTYVTKSISESEKKRLQVKIAERRVKILHLEDDKEARVEAEEFVEAENIKKRIEALRAEQDDLRAQMEPRVVEKRHQLDDNETLQARLQILHTALVASKEPLQTRHEDGVVDTIVLPGVQHPDAEVRNLAIACLGLLSLCDKVFAQKHILLLLQVIQVDQDVLQVTALRHIFDLLLVFGVEAFATGNQISESADSEQERAMERDTTIVPILERYLESDNDDLKTVAVQGFAKLLLSNRLSSVQIVSRLTLLYFNPTTEDLTDLRQCLSVFFPAYAFSSRAHQDDIRESMLPTLRIVFRAPADSPMASVKPSTVADMLMYLTQAERAGLGVHGDLAVALANEVISEPESPDNKVLLKALSLVSWTSLEEEQLRCMVVLMEQVDELMLDSAANKLASKIVDAVQAALGTEGLDGIDEGLREAMQAQAREHQEARQQETQALAAESSTRARRSSRQRKAAQQPISYDDESEPDAESEDDEILSSRQASGKTEYLVRQAGDPEE